MTSDRCGGRGWRASGVPLASPSARVRLGRVVESRLPRVPRLSCTSGAFGGGRMQLFSIIGRVRVRRTVVRESRPRKNGYMPRIFIKWVAVRDFSPGATRK